MVKLQLNKIGTAAIYGAVDIAAEDYDAKRPATGPFRNATDLTRAAAFIAYIAAPMLKQKKGITDITDVIGIASLPLLEKSIWKAVQGQITPRRTANRMTLRHLGTPGNVLRQATSGNVF
ncbi:MAG: hypothetical protein Q7R49_00565 [Candidatus Daviesbacteria bacterium]|nr:hypothetical protein [Candidatus Daviesbacteria bacterium]